MYTKQVTYTQDNFPLDHKRDADLLIESTIRHGGTVDKIFNVTANEMQNGCIYHSKECRMKTVGGSLTAHIGLNGGFRQTCTYHSFMDLIDIRVSKEGFLLKGGNAHP